MTRLLFAIFAAACASAQIHSIEMAFEGVGCVPCVESMPSRAQRIRGVESAKVDAAKGVLTVQLAASNRVRVEQIRDVIEQDGTKARSAVIAVSGAIEKTAEGLTVLRVPQLPAPFQLTGAIPATGERVRGVITNLRATPYLQIAVSIGLFDGHSDVGVTLHPGSAEFDAAKQSYTITGSGDNMWARRDDFHFVWKRIPAAGDLALTADIAFPKAGGNAHRKAVLMVRQSLDGDAAYVDAAVHGDGLTSLQSREEKGSTTHEVGVNAANPSRVRIEKRGDYFYMYLARNGEPLRLAGGSMRLPLDGNIYVGLGVCSHDKDASETAVFSNVTLETSRLYSTLETISVSSTDRRVVAVFPERIEAPNWTPDGQSLIYNSGGRLYRIPAAGNAAPVAIETGFATRNNNDHGLSPDGKMLAISDMTGGKSAIYVLPVEGSREPRRVTAKVPSYWHGWSPDGKTLAYCGERDGKFDIYTIAVEGGEETRLTKGEGHNDGPEYSPDGRYIYFNSSRSGVMQIWRMKPDGSEAPEAMTNDDRANWFPHISPDGTKMVMLSYDKAVTGHPANKDVELRLMNLADRSIRVIAKLFGGQGTINVPSWSPDSKRLAFVSYQILPDTGK